MKTTKRFVSLIFVLTLTLVLVIQPVAATQLSRSMPVPFTYTYDSYKTYPILGESPPGWAKFDITISGTLDVQRDYIVLASSTCVYRGGLNCTEHDMEIVTWTSQSNPGYVFWKLQGTLAFQWTSPVSGMQYESVYVETPTQSFRAIDYA